MRQLKSERERQALKMRQEILISKRAAEWLPGRETTLRPEPELVIPQMQGRTLGNSLSAGGNCRVSNAS